MKTFFAFTSIFLAASLFFSSLGTSRAMEESSWFGEPVSYFVEATNHIKMGVLVSTNDAAAILKPILVFRVTDHYMPKLSSGYAILFEPKPEYFAQFTLFDAENRPVQKTPLGASYQLADIPAWDYKYMKPYNPGMKKSPALPIIVKEGWTMDRITLPRISELFDIKKPGKYRLILEVQVFHDRGTNNRYVVHFPALEIPIYQP